MPQYKQQLYTFCNSGKEDGKHGQTRLRSTISIFVLIKSTGSYYIGKIPTCTIIILCLYKYKQEENPIKDKEFIDCCKLKHSMTQL